MSDQREYQYDLDNAHDQLLVMDETIAALRAELEAVKTENAFLFDACKKVEPMANKLVSDQLTAAQSRIAELRAALEVIELRTNDPFPPYRVMSIECASRIARDALATPDDLSALDRFHDEVVEKVCEYILEHKSQTKAGSAILALLAFDVRLLKRIKP